MNFNKTKCNNTSFYSEGRVVFGESKKSAVQCVTKAMHLGNVLCSKRDHRKEVSSRIANCFATWKKLDVFWKSDNCSIKYKLNVTLYDAVVRCKVLHGLDAIWLTKT